MSGHADLTDPDLHEPKGISSATADSLYVADGSNSGTWEKITADSIDTTSIFNTNIFFLHASLVDVSTASSTYVPIPVDCDVIEVLSVLHGAITVADSTVTVTNNGVSSLGTLTIAYTGSAAGDVDTLTPASNYSFSAGEFLKIATDGGSTTTAIITFVIKCEMT